MDRTLLDKLLTHFQARARGFLVRREVRRARQDFEDIVNEIDGDLTHVLWSSSVIPAPHFTDVDGPYLPRCDVSRPTDSGVDVSMSPQSSAAWTASLSPKTGGEPALLPQKTVAERDDSKSRGQLLQDCFHNNHVEVSEQDLRRRDQEDKDVTDVESTGNATSIWSSLDLDVNNSGSRPGLQQYYLAQDVPQTPEDLRLHRNTLTMELVWIQQAIDSRKKYLSLKKKLTVS